ncbi:MAG: bacitracin ABC transporter ATP-binding protein [Bacillota bacterium]|nr:bacitracin ABC transporter ATP-binding protein [Bacillota bacterium]MDP4161893.1 bacitracin ABC transporter ATP-binding protein [Bacillota bacterium]
MSKEKIPFLSDDFLDEVVRELNLLFGGPAYEQNESAPTNEVE